jgi:hypothetical protein
MTTTVSAASGPGAIGHGGHRGARDLCHPLQALVAAALSIRRNDARVRDLATFSVARACTFAAAFPRCSQGPQTCRSTTGLRIRTPTIEASGGR